MQRREIKKITYLITLILTTLLFVYFLRTPTTINMKQAHKINQQHQTIFLIRHGERCDRSKNACLSSNKGITVNGAIKARDYGKIFSNTFPSFSLYSTDTIRTMQTACFSLEEKQPPGYRWLQHADLMLQRTYSNCHPIIKLPLYSPIIIA
ncbi:transcriptional activator AfrS [Escherichia coli UMNF18]|uniref:histidine phosphatase family protein n=1 Tax=Escherichia coli TaxID=562 RepID=UPI000217D3B1|nr:histidine phosphatase family protein [Escherichia coli]AEJ57056.1 transcriptional activator AfrS [Escherichia coli UMNF18]